MAAGPLPIKELADGITVALRLTPKAKRSGVAGVRDDGEGGVALRVSVTAAPEKGRANAALIRLLAREWGVAKSRISVARGATDRRKVLHIAGDPGALAAQIAAWMEGLDG